jgi:murein DD-endopeptidase MepM/ murein hydrolase activator NlpD
VLENTKKEKYSAIGFLLAICVWGLFFAPDFVFGEKRVSFASSESSASTVEVVKKSLQDEYKRILDEKYNSRLKEGQIDRIILQKILEQKSRDREEILKKSEEYASKIQEIQGVSATLSGQIENLENYIEESEQRIDAISQQIKGKEKDILILSEERSRIASYSEVQQEVVLDLFRLLQTENPSFSFSRDVQQTLESLLADRSFSTSVRTITALSEVEEANRRLFYQFDTTLGELKRVDEILQQKRTAFIELKDELVREQDFLSLQKQAKQDLLANAKSTEQGYQELQTKTLEEMEESLLAIRNIKTEFVKISEKLRLLEQQKAFEEKLLAKTPLSETLHANGGELTEEDLKRILRQQDENDSPLQWPVSPERGITAYFLDKSYKSIFGVPHHAIDIRASQGTEIRAPSAGYVYKAVDNGYGYSYIILLHKENIRTVYGHISEFMVKEGDLVQEGDIIGKTGGMPGSRGAGTMTTGPHLHFEVLKGEEHQNPLEYLPLYQLPLDVALSTQ